MKIEIDYKRLADDLKVHRFSWHYSLRKAADKIGISASTLNRIENQKIEPSVSVFALCCWWLCENIMNYIKISEND